jgi:hypothetical protein
MRDWADELVARARTEGVELTGENGLLTALVRQVLQTGLEQNAASQQVPLLVDAGDLDTAWRQIRHAIVGQIRAGDHLTLWQSLHYLVRVGEQDTAAEIWAELRDRGDWTEAAIRAGLEAQLGPPGQAKLTDNQLITRIATVMEELD